MMLLSTSICPSTDGRANFHTALDVYLDRGLDIMPRSILVEPRNTHPARTKPPERPQLGLILQDVVAILVIVQQRMRHLMGNDSHRLNMSRRPRHLDHSTVAGAEPRPPERMP